LPENGSDASRSETFAIYGFEIKIPGDWRVEVNPKDTRNKGDVVFHSPKINRFYVSWGPLSEATKQFKSLEDHRDFSVANMKKSREVQSLSITGSRESEIHGHKALMTRVDLAAGRISMFGKNRPVSRSTNSLHFYCPERGRYYIIYSLVNSPDEYPDFLDFFEKLAQSMVCH
jgi:hypothetical protein